MSKTLIKISANRISRFGLVGLLNTVLDYIIFIGLTKAFAIPLDRVWMAKLVSGTVAMANSFYLNRKFVFRAHHLNFSKQAVRFLLSTIVGVFVIQLGLVQLFSSVLPEGGILVYEILQTLGLTQLVPNILTEAFVIKTVAFGLATIASLIWNYLTYSRLVFHDSKKL